MLKHEQIESTLIAAAKKQGVRLNSKDLLDIWTKVAATLAVKEHHRQLMSTGEFQWQKPKPPRRLS